MKVYVTDHSSDRNDTGNIKELRKLYTDIRKDGINSVRYDWRWARIEPTRGNFDEDQVERYAQAVRVMSEVGLEPPTIIMSSIPEWALQLYHEARGDFFRHYTSYINHVRNRITELGGDKITHVQVLNEVNNPAYCPIPVHDIIELCGLTKGCFGKYNPEIKTMLSVIVGNLNDTLAKFGIGESAEKYLLEPSDETSSPVYMAADVIAVDFYPGLWHKPFLGERVFGQLDKLEAIFRQIAKWPCDYEIAEVGFPTKWPWGNEEKQTDFFLKFFASFEKILIKFNQEGVKLPSRVGFYEAIDEIPQDTRGKLLRMLTPFPEFDIGVRKSNGRRKLVLEAPNGFSMLNCIVSNLSHY